MVDATHLEELAGAAHRLVRTVDGMTEADYAEPSLLPDWTRGHVVAHLALNGEGLAGTLRGLTEGRSVPVYASPEDRENDIASLGEADPAAIRSRLLGAVTDFTDAVAAVPEEAWTATVERTPGGRSFPASAALDMRQREIEIHHADLGLGYSHRDWPPAFAARLVEAAAARRQPEPFTARATDLDVAWHLGGASSADPGPTVTGTAADLGWWLTGRGEGTGLQCDRGALPEVEPW